MLNSLLPVLFWGPMPILVSLGIVVPMCVAAWNRFTTTWLVLLAVDICYAIGLLHHFAHVHL